MKIYKYLKKEILKSPVFEIMLSCTILWLALLYFHLADFVHKIGIAIGQAFANYFS
jgi:hypothetical protein